MDNGFRDVQQEGFGLFEVEVGRGMSLERECLASGQVITGWIRVD